jgi:hypothetical protein
MAEKTSISWSEVPGKPGYRVSDQGAVESEWRRKGRGRGRAPLLFRSGVFRPLKVSPSKQGYASVSLGRGPRWKVAVLVLLAFVGPKPEGQECRHLNGDRMNSRRDNVAWGTPLENAQDRIRHGTQASGERHGMAKLSDAQAAEALTLLRRGETQTAVAWRFGVGQPCIQRIASGKRKVASCG